ncbi:Aminocyclopropanecarboxylate oxidase protein [Dioscorea alata]|uniref:Aminocyclopropanecarboxylate oxidase protein n=1 Tax=Dioscorea alata TaxID=55571 RepID=A0ACB7UGC5_DIOAL|nr:Aminocyclopropanecarboxylate oxidase protein [Dioscorea alata]
MAGNAEQLELPLIDLSSPDRACSAKSIRKACVDHGFFYLVNHGIEESVLQLVFQDSKKFFSLPLDEKMKLGYKDHRGYTPMFAETLDPSSKIKDVLPCWRATMESYYEQMLAVGKSLISLIALALDLDDLFFEKIGALYQPMAFIRLLHYPGETIEDNNGRLGASAHSDYGMVTLLVTDGVPGLQICRDKDRQPHLWENVPHVNGALVVNVGDLLERWTNCLFRSTLHRVLPPGQERYSVAFFIDPNSDCLVECLETCCSEKNPPRFPAIRSGDHLQARIKASYDL